MQIVTEQNYDEFRRLLDQREIIQSHFEAFLANSAYTEAQRAAIQKSLADTKSEVTQMKRALAVYDAEKAKCKNSSVIVVDVGSEKK